MVWVQAGQREIRLIGHSLIKCVRRYVAVLLVAGVHFIFFEFLPFTAIFFNEKHVRAADHSGEEHVLWKAWFRSLPFSRIFQILLNGQIRLT